VRASSPPPASALVRLRPEPAARVRLVCFPYAGGSGLVYRTWPAALAGLAEVWIAEPPGRGLRLGERAHTRLEPLLDELVHALAPLRDRPLALFGHSMGALVAFELARRLGDHGGPAPAHLFVSGRSPPQVPARAPTHALPRPELLETLRRLDGTPAEVFARPDLIDLFLPILRCDLELVETHVHRAGPLLACPITAFTGREDHDAPAVTGDGWAEHTRGGFSHRTFDGGHFFLRSAERDVLDCVAAALA
jgi:medium-chain acyl-[acyl-carrier-protein] hydrolase